MKIRFKLFLLFFTYIALFSILTTIFYFYGNKVESQLNTLERSNLNEIVGAHAVAFDIQRIKSNIRELFVESQRRKVDKREIAHITEIIDLSLEELKTHLAQWGDGIKIAMAASQADKQGIEYQEELEDLLRFERVNQSTLVFSRSTQELMQIYRQSGYEAALNFFTDHLEPPSRLLQSEVQCYVADVESEVRQETREARKLVQDALASTIALLAISVALCLLFIYLATLHVINPLKKLSIAAKQIGEGDFNISLETNSQDEIGILASSFNKMCDDLTKTTISKDWLNSTINSIYEALIATDGDGNISFINPVACNLVGWKEEDAIGQPLNDVFHIHDDKRGEQIILTKSKVFTFHLTLDPESTAILTRKDGTQLPITGSQAPITDKGELSGLVLVFQDIQEQIQRQKEKEEMQKQIFHSAKLAAIGELAAGVGHEINNPLAIIRGFNIKIKNQISKDSVNTETLKKAVRAQENAVERISNIVSGLRTFASSQEQSTTVFNLNHVIDDTLLFLESIYMKENIILAKDLTDKVPAIEGNIGKVQQVVINLLSNARDATEGLLDRKISIETVLERKTVKMIISDNGSGIPQDVQKRIFESFFTTKEIGKGTGLGLHIVNNIVTQMGGRIDLESEVGKGTSFIISFPRTQKVLADTVKTAKRTFAALSGKVMVVEDEPDIRTILVELLEGFGLTVDSAPNGAEALRVIVHKNDYDLIITDLKMPILRGEELVAQLKQDSSFKSKIIVITGSIGPTIEDLKVEGFIRKPFTKENIYDNIVKILGQASS